MSTRTLSALICASLLAAVPVEGSDDEAPPPWLGGLVDYGDVTLAIPEEWVAVLAVDSWVAAVLVVESAEVLAPESSARITVREASGRPMTYTLAVVDEGLLGLTRFGTPNPWDHFYAREALGVKTWDLYDQVVGAWGGVLERMLAIGGDEEGVRAELELAGPVVRIGRAIDNEIRLSDHQISRHHCRIEADERGVRGAVFHRRYLLWLQPPQRAGPESSSDSFRRCP